MKIRLLLIVVGAVVVIVFAAGCGAQPEPMAASLAETPEPVFIVVTATEEPPTPTPEVVIVVVTATEDPESLVQAEEVEQPEATVKPIPEGAETPQEIAEAPAEAAETEAAAESQPDVEMSLAAQKTTTQHSPRPESFVEPASLEEIRPHDDWYDIAPNNAAEFQSYDGVRVLDGGEAVLDLGNLMKLILRHDSEIQFVPGSLVQQELDKIAVDFSASSPLEELVLAAHLLRGGFLGEKTIGGDPIALTTPNAVVVISGTEFFLAYDPTANTTWVGKFEGTMSVADVVMREGEAMPDRQLIAIPAVRGRKYWPIDSDMTPEEFVRLIDLQQSPVAAADMISGPYLRVKFSPELAVRNGPGTEFAYVGDINEGDYVRVIGRGRGWWEIECPAHLSGNDCWVSGGSAYVDEYNIDISPVPNTAPALPPTATPTMTPTPKAAINPVTPVAPAPPGTSPGDVFNCSYIGNDKFEWYTNEGGPFTGIWQSGCPASPSIAISGCTVVWDAGNNNVTSATVGINRKGYAYSVLIDEYEEFPASLPSGSRSLAPPDVFEGEVKVFFNLTLDNGIQESKKASKTFDYEEDYYGICF
jgi:outer membrane biosynthesis protein TonB